MSAFSDELPPDDPPPPESFETAKPAPKPVPAAIVRRDHPPAIEPRREFRPLPPIAAIAGRTLPHSIEAEEQLLSCCLLDGSDTIARCIEAHLQPSVFFDHANRLIFERILALYAKAPPVELAVLADELRSSGQLSTVGGYQHLIKISGLIGTTAQVGHFIQRVKDMHILRELIKTAISIVEQAFQYSGGIDEFIERTQMQFATVSGGAGGAMQARIEAARLRLDIQPPPLRVVFTLNNVSIATPGNLAVISAQAKAGKTAVVGAAIGSTLSQDPACDFLGIQGFNAKGFAVIHVDSEQALADHWANIKTALCRAKTENAPAWLHSYSTAGWSATDRRLALPVMLRQAKQAHGGVHAMFLDGVADFVADPNDAAECFEFIDWLHGLSTKFDCPIFTVLHLNPGTEKSRGHLGSQLERRAETNLVLEKDADSGRTVVFSTKQRRAPIQKADGPNFRWDDAEKMHLSVETQRTTRDSADADAACELANEVFGSSTSRRYTELIEAIKSACGCSDRTADRKFNAMRKHKIIERYPPNLWAKAI